MNNGTGCIVLSMNLLNWGIYGPVAESKVYNVCRLVAESRPQLLCLSEIGPGDAIEQLTRPLQDRGLDYFALSVGKPNKRGIRNAVLATRGIEVLEARLNVPMELTLPRISLENFELGEMRLRLSREPLAVLVRVHTPDTDFNTPETRKSFTLAVGFFHPKSKLPEDFVTGEYPKEARDQTYMGICKMISSLRNFGQCLLAREFVDRFWELNPLRPEWDVKPDDVRFVLVGDWNANPQEEQRLALRGYLDGGLPSDTLLVDSIGSASTDMADICTIPWGGKPNSFDAIYVDKRLESVSESRILPVDAVDFFGLPDQERERLENQVLDHRPVGLYLR